MRILRAIKHVKTFSDNWIVIVQESRLLNRGLRGVLCVESRCEQQMGRAEQPWRRSAH